MNSPHHLKMNRLICSLATICLLSLSAFAQDPDRTVYDNDLLFSQVSGAKRILLERKFGKKESIGVEKSVGSSSGWTGADSPVGGGGNSILALTNTLVNFAAADATSQDTQSETGLVLGSGSNIICGFNDSGSYLGGASKFTGWSRSTDGGTTWTDGGALPTNASGDAGDPALARNTTTGRVYMSTLAFTANTLQIWRSDDNGATWLAPVNGSPGQASGSQDKEWIAVDNFAGFGNGNVYMFWRNFGTPSGMNFSRSIDNGTTWTVTQAPLSGVTGGQGAFVAVGPDHSVYCFWLNGTSIGLRKSTDLGLTFGSTITVTSLLTTGSNGDLGLGFRSNAFPHAAVNPVNGNVYVVYDDNPAGVDRGDVYFRQSTDGGATWGSQVRVNDDAGTNDNWEPTLAATPDGTALCVTWYDRRSDGANTIISRWGATATISGSTVTFGSNFPVSDVFPPVYGVDPVVNSVYMGDYDQMAADNSFFYTVWGDNRDQSIAVPARKNANVRFAKIPKAGPPPAPLLSFDSGGMVAGTGNGNGFVDANECNNVNITVKNNGNATASGITGTLSTSTPGATVTVFSSPYANLAPGTTGTNTVPFKISTSPGYVCGTPVALTLTLTYTGGSNVATTSLPSVGAGYVITSSTGASIDPGTTDIGNHGDDVFTAITLPFTYSYYGTNFTAANVTSNGNLQFSSSNTAFTNECLPTATMTDLISPHWDDQRTDLTFSGKGIFTSTSGVTPNRIFNIEWRTVYFSNTAQNANFEIRLYEGQQKFDIIYGTMDQSGTSATVGCQQGTGLSSTQHECNTGGLTSGLMLTFTFATCTDAGGAGCPVPIVLGVPVNVGWNMISNPVTATNDSVRVLYPTSTLDYAYSYNGGYVQDYTMENRQGYWETFPSAITQNITGLPITRDTFNVVTGWNMVGSISNPVDTSTIVSIPPGLRTSDWYGSNGAYFVATQLNPGKAYWVKTNNAGKFVLANPPLARTINGRLSRVNPADVLNTLTITDSRGHSQTLYFGADEKKSLPVSMYAMPPLPPVGTFDARFSTADGGSMVQTHGAGASAGTEFIVAIQSDAYPVTVTWNVKNSSYDLTDGLGNKAFSPKEMNGEGTFRIANSSINKVSVKLTGGTQLPKEFALSQNYPNPFNPSTTIKYDLPVDTRVSLKVFNIIGQEVLSLVNEEQKAGYKSVKWNAANVASGVYFYTIEAGQFRASKKLLLIR